MNAALANVLKAAGISAVNAIPVAGQLFAVFAPIVAGMIQKHQEAKGIDAPVPTVEQMTAQFMATLDQGDAEWAAWVAMHPKPPTPSDG